MDNDEKKSCQKDHSKENIFDFTHLLLMHTVIFVLLLPYHGLFIESKSIYTTHPSVITNYRRVLIGIRVRSIILDARFRPQWGP